MIKIGMLLPYEDMLLLAKRVIEETGIQVDYIKVVKREMHLKPGRIS